MNIGITTSFIIGGLLLIAIVTLNNRMMQNSGQNALDMIVKTNVETLADILSSDIRRIGYLSTTNITTAEANRLVFEGDVTGDGVPDEVDWFFNAATDVPETVNPNDRRITRTVGGQLTDLSSLSVTLMRFQYTLINGTVTSNPSNLNQIRRVFVEIVCESPEAYGDDFKAASWQKTFAPANIQF
ncbi:MAG: hypothetical protein EA364_11495 [Balneolaceae bacterium]|nr:MAG: hypothetical protein EA364_11495 [Balneolaceae bacterium]